MASDDLFVWLDALWNKGKPEGTFPTYYAHRFLASNRDLANAARILGKDVHEPAMVFATWQGLLPEDRGAPRLTYPAPKKRPEAEQLTLRMMAVLGVRRQVAEEMQALLADAGRLVALYAEMGVAPPDAEADVDAPAERPQQRKRKEPVGLMAQIKARNIP
jgi:hypothetical protein